MNLPTDNDNNGLVDNVDSYQLFNDGEGIDLDKGDGKTVSDKSSGNWNSHSK